MPNNYYKSFDDIRQAILADYQNLDPSPDISQGSPVNIKGTVLASAIWSLYKYNDWLDRQRMPGDTADGDQLDRWGTVFGIPRLSGETDSDYAARMTSLFRLPPAGGTAADYGSWALAATAGGIPANTAEDFLPAAVSVSDNNIMLDGTVNALGWADGDPVNFTSTGALPSPLSAGTAYYAVRQDSTSIGVASSAGGPRVTISDQGTGIHNVSHAAQSGDPNSFWVSEASVITPNSVRVPTAPGTVAVVLVPDDESILDISNVYHPATWALTEATDAYIAARAPVTAGINSVSMEDTTSYDIFMTVSPVTASVAPIRTDILSYVNSLTPGAVLYKVQLEAIALRDGAVNASVTSPVFDLNGQIIPDSTTAIRSSTVNIALSV